MNGQTDSSDRARLVVGIGAAIFGAVQKIAGGQPAARVLISTAHDVLDIAGHDHTFDPDNPVRVAVAAAAVNRDLLGDDRGADGLTDQERASGMTAASVLGENLNTAGDSMDHTEQTLPVAGAASGEGGGSDFTLPAAVDRRVPGDYIPPDSSRDFRGDVDRSSELQAVADAGRERFNLGEASERDRSLAADGGEQQRSDPNNPAADWNGNVPSDGGKIQEQDPADGGRIQEQDPTDGGRIDQDRDASQQ